MRRYIIKRIALMLLLLLGMSFIVFASLYIAPGDPATMVAGPAWAWISPSWSSILCTCGGW